MGPKTTSTTRRAAGASSRPRISSRPKSPASTCTGSTSPRVAKAARSNRSKTTATTRPTCSVRCPGLQSRSPAPVLASLIRVPGDAGAEAVRIIGSHPPSVPLFFYLPWQGVHAPAQAPRSYIEPYARRIADPTRRVFAGMLSAVDEGTGNVTAALRSRGLWDNLVCLENRHNLLRLAVACRRLITVRCFLRTSRCHGGPVSSDPKGLCGHDRQRRPDHRVWRYRCQER